MWFFGTIGSQSRVWATPLPIVSHNDGGGGHSEGEGRHGTFCEARIAMVSPLGRSQGKGDRCKLRGGRGRIVTGDRAAGGWRQRLRKGRSIVRERDGIVARFLHLRLGRGLRGIGQFGDARDTGTHGQSPFGGDV